MSRVDKILHIEDHKTYAVVHVRLSDGMEAQIFVGGEVETFFDPKHNKIKAYVKRTKSVHKPESGLTN